MRLANLCAGPVARLAHLHKQWPAGKRERESERKQNEGRVVASQIQRASHEPYLFRRRRRRRVSLLPADAKTHILLYAAKLAGGRRFARNINQRPPRARVRSRRTGSAQVNADAPVHCELDPFAFSFRSPTHIHNQSTPTPPLRVGARFADTAQTKTKTRLLAADTIGFRDVSV